MAHPFFQVERYPWSRPEAVRLHEVLYGAVKDPNEIDLIYQKCGARLPLALAHAPRVIWKDVLELVAADGLLEGLCRRVREQFPAKAAIQDAVLAVVEAPSALDLQIFPGDDGDDDVFVLDRSVLRQHLERLQSPQTALKVLLVRGERRSGKSQIVAPRAVKLETAGIMADRADDWAVLRSAAPLDPAWTVIPLSGAATPVKDDPAYLIQHPGGERKRVGFVRNQVSYFDNRVVHYLTDTQVGSSGSPVFDARGRLIALHHAGGRPQEVVGKPPVKKNEGIRIPRIVAALAARGVDAAAGR